MKRPQDAQCDKRKERKRARIMQERRIGPTSLHLSFLLCPFVCGHSDHRTVNSILTERPRLISTVHSSFLQPSKKKKRELHCTSALLGGPDSVREGGASTELLILILGSFFFTSVQEHRDD